MNKTFWSFKNKNYIKINIELIKNKTSMYFRDKK